jgi:hypothetical protein
MTTTRNTPECVTTLHAVAAKAHEALPLANGRIEKAVALVLGGGVTLTDHGAVVQSQSQHGVRWHCQLNGKSSTDAFPSRQSDGVQRAKIQRFMKEQNQEEVFLYCTNVEFFPLS